MEDKKIKTDEETVEQTEETHVSELLSPVWSVIAFDGCLASGLSYDEAVRELGRRLAEKHSGLCIVTDEAAGRMRRS